MADVPGGLPPRRPRSDASRPQGNRSQGARPQGARPAGARRKKKQGMSGWMIAGIVALCLAPVFCCGGIMLFALLGPAVQQAQQAAQRSQSQNNLKQIGLAGHNFHSVHGAFPPHTKLSEANYAHQLGSFDPSRPRMSWMTASLPFVGRTDLWDRAREDLDVPFDDPSVADVYETRVEPYLSPAAPPSAGGLAPAHYAGNVHLLGEEFSGQMRDVTDGMSSTIYAGEVDPIGGNPAAWGDPDNLRDPADGLNVPGGFGSSWKNGDGSGGVQVVLGDGSVRFLSGNVDPAVLRALGTPAGGEVVGDF